jgi:hypothetical protein
MAVYGPVSKPGWFGKAGPQTFSEAFASTFEPGALGTIAPNNVGLDIPSGTVKLGTGHFPRLWQFVQLDASSATPAFGQVVCWKDGLAASNYTVITGTSAALRSRPAGIVASASVTLGQCIWIIVYGVAPAGRAQSSLAADVTYTPCFGAALGAKTIAFDGSSALPTDTIAALVKFSSVGV